MKYLALGFILAAAAVAEQRESFPLWKDGAPGALGKEDKDVPSLTPYVPSENATGAAVIVCPGGAYWGLAAHEGADYAAFLNQHGITSFVLKYRLASGGYKHPAMLQDVSRAMRLVRARAKEWNVAPERIAIMGSSAGGHLASTLLTHFDSGNAHAEDPIERESSRPSLGILCYPVITMGPNTHGGSKTNLLGKTPSADLIEFLSNEKHVTSQTPPCFIFHTWEDKAVKVENSLEFAQALQKAGVPFDLHVYQQGRHGIGLNDKAPFQKIHPWAKTLTFWLNAQGWVK